MALFGTDGVRGIPGTYPLEPDLLERLGEAAGSHLRAECGSADRPVLMARDTRDSGPWILKALAKGIARAGCRTLVDLKILPTPALSYLVPSRRALFGVVISASHNPPEFNGVKFFDHRGRKLSPGAERAIERRLRRPASRRKAAAPPLQEDPSAAQAYLDFLVSTFPPDLDLAGLKIVADAAHGAAARLVGPLLRRLGADVRVLGDRPNGRNINKGFGALAPEAMCRAVRAARADCGFSLDGDADRVLFADERGRLMSGDTLIGMAAAFLQERGALGPQKVVTTVMSNAGLAHFLRERGIETVRVPVGDRNVTEAMESKGLRLGGENSGHIIFGLYSDSGDGMLTALQVLAMMRASGRTLSRFRNLIPSYPQVLTGVPVKRRVPLERLPRLGAAVRRGERELKDGRIFLRYSGTEPLLRILVEGPESRRVRRIAAEITELCRKELNDHAC
jgi:phosphoglucosamine mutase